MIEVKYEKNRKRLDINGALGLSSVETVEVADDAGVALAEGTLCLHDEGCDTALAEWAVDSGQCETDTRAPALTAWFAAHPAHMCQEFVARIKDADGNLLGAGCLTVIDSCASVEGADGGPAGGGPLEAEAAVEIAAGCPVKLVDGLAHPCAAGDHARFLGIARNHAEAGGTVRVVRWGSVHIPGWELTAGVTYWLPQSGQALASAPAGIACCAGLAQDANTLLLSTGRLAVQAGAGALLGYLVWDATNKRLAVVQASAAGGPDAANRIVAAGHDGVLDPAFIPRSAVADAIAEAFAGVQSLPLPGAATLNQAVATLNQILAILKGE